MKKYWTGFQDGNVRFFDQDPTGSVENIEGVSELNIDGDITGNNGESLVTCLHQQQASQGSSSAQTA